MKSTRDNYSTFRMLSSAVNPWRTSIGTHTLWSFEEALVSYLDDSLDSLEDGASAYRTRESELYDTTDLWDGTDTFMSSTDKFHMSSTEVEGVTVYARLDDEGGTPDSNSKLRKFFPDVFGGSGDLWENDEDHISKLRNQTVYYRVPTLSNKGYLRSDRHFALAVSNSFYKRTASGYDYFDPCSSCNTIGKNYNGWDEMKLFYAGTGGEGAYNPFSIGTDQYFTSDSSYNWETAAVELLSLGVLGGAYDLAGYDQLIAAMELNENTYGSAAFQTFSILELWYGILTTYSAGEGAFGDFAEASKVDDLYSLTFYHPYARAFTLGYDSSRIYEPTVGYITAEHDTSISRDNVTKNPYVYPPDHAKSLTVSEAVTGNTSGEGSVTGIHARTGGVVVMDHGNYSSTWDIIRGDLKRRFQGRTNNVHPLKHRMSSQTKAAGFLAQKAWLLQNSLTIWSGLIDDKINQQLSPNLDMKLMHPVGNSQSDPTYSDTTSTSTPTGGTTGGSMGGSTGGSY